MTTMRLPIFAVALLMATLPRLATAQLNPRDFHGALTVNAGSGIFDAITGNLTMKATGWRLDIVDGSDGIFPDRELVQVKVGPPQEDFRLTTPMRMSRNGKVFTYKPKPVPVRGVSMLRLKKKPDGTWDLRFKLQGIDLSDFIVHQPTCKGIALFVGDDDF